FARGSILRGVITDRKSPITYGFDGKDLPVYFNQDPVLMAGGGFGGFGGGGGRGGFGGGGSSEGQNVTPNAAPIPISPWDSSTPQAATQPSQADQAASMRQQMRAFGIIEEAR